MTLALLVALALAQPLEVLEEWELVGDAPLRESVTARGVYRRADGPRALLPAVLQQPDGPRPEAFAPGTRDDLVVTRGARGWEVALPPGENPMVRVVARVVRPVRDVRLFRASWPAVIPASVPTRRVAEVPRAWLAQSPRTAWSCADDELAEVIPCVATARDPGALLARIPAPPASRLALALAALAVIAAVIACALPGPPAHRRVRALGALAGAGVGLAVALGLAGAHALGWPAAIAIAGVSCALLGALATRSERGVAAGGIALLIVPLVVVANGRLVVVLGASAVAAVAIITAVVLARRAPAATPPPAG